MRLNALWSLLSFSNTANQKSISSLPEDWENIDLTELQEAFKTLKTKKQQDFGKTQLKAIYLNTKLSASDIQKSISKFAYGVRYLSNKEPYSNMKNPAALLFDKLKNNDRWDDNRYLTEKENILFSVYKNLAIQIDQDIDHYFKKWKEIDRSKKFEHYKNKQSSTHFYDERVFSEKAWIDYSTNIWPEEKKIILAQMSGISDEITITKFAHILESND